MEAANITPPESLSLLRRWLATPPLGVSPRLAYLTAVFGSLLFSLPRYGEGWFVWAALALPFSTAAMLELARQVEAALDRIRARALALVEDADGREQLAGRWERLDRRAHRWEKSSPS